jgi:hypothetical protein
VDEDTIAAFVPYSSDSSKVRLKLQEVRQHRRNDHVYSPAGLNVMIRWELHSSPLILGDDEQRVF